jgi:sugar/nucleoside kinase (ribokinase family)
MKKDIITFGAGSEDIYLISKGFSGLSGEKIDVGKKICLKIGSKTDFDEIIFRTGGGGTNVAATFKKQGFNVAWCGMVGKDYAAEKIIKELKEKGIDVSLISRTDKKPTNRSVILAASGKERTILVYRGASGELKKESIPWNKLDAKWFYVAPLSGRTALLTEDIIDFAKKKKAKVAANLGSSQLSLSQAQLKRILKKIDVLILNRQEASFLTKLPYQKEKEVFKRLDKMVEGICIMTKGRDGVVASDGKYLYSAPAPKIEFTDSTGAGDSFSSGFVSGLIKKNDIVFAVQLGMANSVSCLKKWGAKEGLLSRNQLFSKVKVKKITLK